MSYETSPVWFGYNGHPSYIKKPKDCVLIDLDGTLLNNEHRQHFMKREKKDWASFFAHMKFDRPHLEVLMLVDLIFKHTEIAVLLVTGRPSQYHGATVQNLHDYSVSFSALIMRAQKDNRSDVEVKKDMLHAIKDMGYRPILVIDDRPEVVNMWRQYKVRTLAADPGAWRDHAEAAGLMDKLALIDENERLRQRIEELEISMRGDARQAIA
jgi:hypothetical protein